MERLGAQNWVLRLIVRDYSLESQSTLDVWEAAFFRVRAADRGSCSLQDSLLSNLSEASLLDPRGVKFWKTLLTLAAARWCHFISRQVLHKNASCLSNTHAHRVVPLAAVLARWKREGRPAGRCQANPTQRNLPRLTCCCERGGTEWPRFGWKPLQTFPNTACGRGGEWASELAGASRWGSFADCKWLPLAPVDVVCVPGEEEEEDEGEQ